MAATRGPSGAAKSAPAAVRLTVKGLAGLEEVVEVAADAAVRDVKLAVLAGALGDSLRGQFLFHLLHAGRQLEVRRSLADYRIEDGDTLFLVSRSRGGSGNSMPDVDIEGTGDDGWNAVENG